VVVVTTRVSGWARTDGLDVHDAVPTHGPRPLGSVLILLGNKLAFLVFAVSLAAFLVSLIYTYVLTDGGEIMGGQMAITSVVITALLLFFLWYSWLMTKRSVLR
jgi:hypothetical protein